MKIIMFYASWCDKCKLFMGKNKPTYDTEVNIDLPSYKKTMIKYQVSIVPTFIALADNGRVMGKLVNPLDMDEYKTWKEKFKK